MPRSKMIDPLRFRDEDFLKSVLPNMAWKTFLPYDMDNMNIKVVYPKHAPYEYLLQLAFWFLRKMCLQSNKSHLGWKVKG